MEGKKMDEYKRFLAIWDCVHIMNAAGVFVYGIAKHGNGGPVIVFENNEQKQRYKAIFE